MYLCPPSPVRIIAQVQWFVYQNRLEPSGGIYHLYKRNRLLWLRVNIIIFTATRFLSRQEKSSNRQRRQVRIWIWKLKMNEYYFCGDFTLLLPAISKRSFSDLRMSLRFLFDKMVCRKTIIFLTLGKRKWKIFFKFFGASHNIWTLDRARGQK